MRSSSALRASAAPGQMAGPLQVPGSDLVPAEMPFFLGKATIDLGDEPGRRWAEQEAPAGKAAEVDQPTESLEGAGLDAAALRTEGFHGFVSFEQLRSGDLDRVPESGGVYVVVRGMPARPVFLDSSPGGRFKGKDPTELVDVLQAKSVEDADIVYIGKGGNLRRRLKEYSAFGTGKPVGHWGGRYIWQLADADALMVGWRVCVAEQTPAEAEATLVRRFKTAFGRLPFANIADPST